MHKWTIESCRARRHRSRFENMALGGCPGSCCRIQHEHRTPSTPSTGMKCHQDYLKRGRRRETFSFIPSREVHFFCS
jgi:hypothetical protein